MFLLNKTLNLIGINLLWSFLAFTDCDLGCHTSLTYVVLMLGIEVENLSRVRRKVQSIITVAVSCILACHAGSSQTFVKGVAKYIWVFSQRHDK